MEKLIAASVPEYQLAPKEKRHRPARALNGQKI
jgi:hypothetical protein